MSQRVALGRGWTNLFCLKYNKQETHPQDTRHGDSGGSGVALLLVLGFQDNPRSDASKDGDDEDVDWKHEKATLDAHHDLLPCDLQGAWEGGEESKQSKINLWRLACWDFSLHDMYMFFFFKKD